MDTLTDRKPAGPAELFDSEAVAAELNRLALDYGGRERELRLAVAQRLKAAVADGMAKAEELLFQDRQGRRCAERLSRMQDEIIRVLYEFSTTHLYTAQNPSEGEHMAIVATGGYGRGMLAPGSDIDLLFLLPYKQTAWGESIAEAILYCLWDMGLKVGHATRSVDECIRQAKADMTIRTAILEARFLLGEQSLFDELVQRFDNDIARTTGPEFVAAKLAEREERLRRVGQSRYLVEPNVKDGKGGLRDLHTLFWIAKYVYRVRKPDELIDCGVFNRQEYRLFQRCETFLWSVRCHMHFAAGRAEERLSFDIQREMAERLGYTSHPGMRDVERFMKHYFLVAKDVGDLTAILCAALESRHQKEMPMLNRFVARLRQRPPRVLRESDDFIIENNRINLADPEAFQRDPTNLVRIFSLGQRHNLAFHPDAMRTATRSLKLIDKHLRAGGDAYRCFYEILTANNATEIVLRRMNETGVLGRLIPDFGRVVSMMQFNMYHHYTVDEHLLRCIGVLAEIEAGQNEEYGLANELMRTILPEHRNLLYVALFLHDIAKGRTEDHSIAGARIARHLCPRMGMSAADTETVAWLVENHLVMSSIASSHATRRTARLSRISHHRAAVETHEAVTVLTTADIRRRRTGGMEQLEAQLLRASIT
ncbi:MAG: [protein-PII] uridylyltransferase [Xanthobacteraceae bacterium]